ncbi:hypothetical protein KJ567_03805, partial [Candidatus Bipolaricaulota bacterium]|nr:hypothetical protein [Candidatus Bipolaricaulota bacterium]
SETPHSRLLAPFFAPGVVAAFNRLPLSLTARFLYVGRKKTRSPFPFAEKYVLRKLLAADAPEELLYRRKATAGARGSFYAALWESVLRPALVAWAPALDSQVAGTNRAIIDAFRGEMLGPGSTDAWPLGRESMMMFLGALAFTCGNPTSNLTAEIAALPSRARRPPENRRGEGS